MWSAKIEGAAWLTWAASIMVVSLSSVNCRPVPISTTPLTISFTSHLALVACSPISSRTHARSCSTCAAQASELFTSAYWTCTVHVS